MGKLTAQLERLKRLVRLDCLSWVEFNQQQETRLLHAPARKVKSLNSAFVD